LLVLLVSFGVSLLLCDDGSCDPSERVGLDRDVPELGLLHQDVILPMNTAASEILGPETQGTSAFKPDAFLAL
jgi:hypothetical protein